MEENDNSVWAYPDVHHHVDSAQAFLDFFKPKRVIWLGDFLDRFNDGPEDAWKTGKWLKNLVETRLNDVFLISNHDISYRFENHEKYKGWGWSPEKSYAFHSQFPREYWNKFKLYYLIHWNREPLLFSHAGFNHKMVPFGTFSEGALRKICDKALKNGNERGENLLLDSPFGPLWYRDASFLNGVNQIVGHTPMSEPAVTKFYTVNFAIQCDCAHTYVLQITDDTIYSVNKNTGEKKVLVQSKYKLNL